MTRRINQAIIMTFALALLAAPCSWADGYGAVTRVFAGGNANDTRSCTFFQTNNGTQWYAVPLTDSGYESELSLLTTSLISRGAIQVDFVVVGAPGNCQYPGVTNLQGYLQ